MAKAKATRAMTVEEPAATPQTRSPAAPWWIGFGFLAILAIVLVWLPISRINAHYEINYNEGWNVYPQQAAATGVKLYGQGPVREYWNYPPVAFHVVGLLGRMSGNYNIAGRWVCFLSFLALVALTSLTVQRLTGSWRSAAFSALFVVIFIGGLKSERIAMNDPHQLGMAIIAFGFYAYVRSADSPLWLRISAAAFVIGLFTKHSLLAFPIAVAIQLLITSKKRLIEWIATGAATAVLLLVLTFVVDGSHFFEHLALPREYSYAFFLSNTVWYLLMFQTAILLALAWCFRTKLREPESVLVWAYAAATTLGFWFSAGGGADLNHLFDSLVAIAMIGGVALPYAVFISERVRYSPALLTVLIVLPFSLGVLTMLPPRVQEDLQTSHTIPQQEQDSSAAVQFLKARPGPALCEQMVICFEAGKPEEYDAYEIDQFLRTGKVSESEVLKLLDSRHFTAIQLLMDSSHPIAPVERPGFSQAFMTHLLNGYKPALQTSSSAIMVPK
jgi:hypothetical protein